MALPWSHKKDNGENNQVRGLKPMGGTYGEHKENNTARQPLPPPPAGTQPRKFHDVEPNLSGGVDDIRAGWGHDAPNYPPEKQKIGPGPPVWFHEQRVAAQNTPWDKQGSPMVQAAREKRAAKRGPVAPWREEKFEWETDEDLER